MKKILLVDDESGLVFMVEARLKANGYEVVTAYNGIDGFETAIAEKPAIILLDIMMPKQDGFVTLQKIREHSEIGQTPVVMFSAKIHPEDMERAKKLGATDFVKKPFVAESLLETLKTILG